MPSTIQKFCLSSRHGFIRDPVSSLFEHISAAGFSPSRFFIGMKIAFVRIMNKIPAKTALSCGVFTTGVNLIHMRRSVLISFQYFNKGQL